jgi:hypothetical protein
VGSKLEGRPSDLSPQSHSSVSFDALPFLNPDDADRQRESRQILRLNIEDFWQPTPNSRFVHKLPTAPTHLSSGKPGCALWIS